MCRGVSYVVSGRREVGSGSSRVGTWSVAVWDVDGSMFSKKKLGEQRRRLVSEDVGEWYRRNKLWR